MALSVTVENFIRAESDRMFASLQTEAGGLNRLKHSRAPTPIDHQPVIRMNRDTLYSSAIVDISQGATVTLPDAGDRYVSVMVVNQDHFINQILHEPGEHRLTVEEFDTPWVGVAARILVDPADEDDLATVNALQDHLGVDANSSRPFEMPDYDTASLDATRKALLELAKHLGSFDRAFGAKRDVDPVRHLVATAAGWGGLPTGRRATSESNPRFPWASTSSRSGTYPSMGSGRSRSTTRRASSRQTTVTPIASTTSPRPQTTMARSPSTSAVAATIGRTACRLWEAGTTRSGCTDPAPRCSTARGPSQPLSRPEQRRRQGAGARSHGRPRFRSDRPPAGRSKRKRPTLASRRRADDRLQRCDDVWQRSAGLKPDHVVDVGSCDANGWHPRVEGYGVVHPAGGEPKDQVPAPLAAEREDGL